ncbi:MAG TPA: pilus assembly protein PilP, partial [Kofleriaceae bacterium]|nr:pilus assembly protein PilP [Kofleriaceae bacterium]
RERDVVRARRAILLAALCWLAPACGEDEDAPVQARPGQATPAPPVGGASAAGGPGAGSGRQLTPQLSIEDRVVCRVESIPSKRCDPKRPRCAQGEYCIANTDGSFCGPCQERDTIRRVFRPRDFVSTIETRDPFQSFIVAQPGLGSRSDDDRQTDPAKNCRREDQMVAQSYSYQDLKLVGIVTQGTQRKVLMIDSTNLGHIIRRGDCVGKEKAVVKEIGKEFITFEIHPDGVAADGKREPEQRSIQLYPKQLPVSSLPAEQPSRGAAPPIVAPPPAMPSPGGGNGAAARPGTRIQIVPPGSPQAPAVPPQAPTTLAP